MKKQMKKWAGKRILSIALALAMLVSNTGLTAFAAEPDASAVTEAQTETDTTEQTEIVNEGEEKEGTAQTEEAEETQNPTKEKATEETVEIPETEATASEPVQETARTLSEGDDYTVSWQKNRNAGTATAVFTGKGGFTGTRKKTFKIKAFNIAGDTDNRFNIAVENESVPYAKGGAKPVLHVTFKKDDGTVQKLTEGTDYTVTYKNNTAVNDGSNTAKIPTAVIKGKGNFTGTKQVYYKVTEQELGRLTLTAADKSYQNKKNIFATKITITDLDGKTLKAGRDYLKSVTYTYKNDTTLDNGTVRAAGTAVDRSDIIPAGTWIVVTASACAGGNYTGSISGEYRITRSNISTAKVTIPKQTYTGKAITLEETQITVTMKGTALTPEQYQIIPGSYRNNVKKGTASVTIRGLGNYGGTKTVKFTIRAKGFLWWWKN